LLRLQITASFLPERISRKLITNLFCLKAPPLTHSRFNFGNIFNFLWYGAKEFSLFS